MKRLMIEFDYDNDGLAHDGAGMPLDRQYSYSPGESKVYAWHYLHFSDVESEQEAKDVIEWDIVRNWPGEYAALYMFQFMRDRRDHAVRLLNLMEDIRGGATA